MNTAEQKNKKAGLAIDLLLIALPQLIIGIWMLIDTAGMEHLEIEKAGVYFFKKIWGAPAGLSLIIFSLVFSIIAFIKFKKSSPVKPKTQTYKYFELSFGALVYTIILYAIVIIQSVLSNQGIISSQFAFKESSEIHLVFITFIVVISIIVLIFRLSVKLPKK